MKNTFLSFLFLSSILTSAQQHNCAKAKQAALKNQLQHQVRTTSLLPQISHELKYDVKFVHLNLN